MHGNSQNHAINFVYVKENGVSRQRRIIIMSFLNQIKQRRTIYALGKDISLDQAKVEEIIKDAVKHSPSAFNSQSSRAVILLALRII